MSTTSIWKDVFDAALSNDIDSVKYFVEVKGDPVTITNSDEKSIAHIAAEFGRLSVLRYILGKDPSLLEVSDIFGYTVLHRAVEFGDLDVVKYLVDECEADMYRPTLLLPGNSAFHIAAQKGKFDVFEYFVTKKGIDVHLRNRLGEPALFSAAERPYMRIIQFLIEDCNADPMMLDSNRDNILFKSARRGDLMLPKYLLDKRNLTYDLDWTDVNGNTVINLASKYNKVGIVNFMLQRNASLSIPDTLKRTPLHHAALRGYYQLGKLLVEYGASCDTEDASGVTPLQVVTDPKLKTFLFMSKLKQQSGSRVRRSVPGLESSILYMTAARRNDSSPKLLGNEDVNSNLTLNSVLLVVITIMKRIRDTVHGTTTHPSLFSPRELIQRRLNITAIDAVENLLVFEEQ